MNRAERAKLLAKGGVVALPPDPAENERPAAPDPRRLEWHRLFNEARESGIGGFVQIKCHERYNHAIEEAHRLRKYASTLVPPGVWDIRAENLKDEKGEFILSSLQVKFIREADTPTILASAKGRRPTTQRHTVERAEPEPPVVSEQPSGGDDGAGATEGDESAIPEWVLPAVEELETIYDDFNRAGLIVEGMMQDAPEVYEDANLPNDTAG